METLKKIVDFTQVKLAEASVDFLQREAAHLGGHTEAQLKMVKLISLTDKEAILKRPCSFAFYNFKTILLRAQEERIPILVKKYLIGQDKPVAIFYRSPNPKEPFSAMSKEEVANLKPKDPLFVLEGFLPEGMETETLGKLIDKQSLLDIALMNVARVPQYSSQDFDPKEVDEIARREIEKYRELAKELGCDLQKPRTYTIVHTHASSVAEEKGV